MFTFSPNLLSVIIKDLFKTNDSIYAYNNVNTNYADTNKTSHEFRYKFVYQGIELWNTMLQNMVSEVSIQNYMYIYVHVYIPA